MQEKVQNFSAKKRHDILDLFLENYVYCVKFDRVFMYTLVTLYFVHFVVKITEPLLTKFCVIWSNC